MAYNGTRCLTDEEVEAYVWGDMSSEETKLAEKHLDACVACDDRINSAFGDDDELDYSESDLDDEDVDEEEE